jgi:hypothetical protein
MKIMRKSSSGMTSNNSILPTSTNNILIQPLISTNEDLALNSNKKWTKYAYIFRILILKLKEIFTYNSKLSIFTDYNLSKYSYKLQYENNKFQS